MVLMLQRSNKYSDTLLSKSINTTVQKYSVTSQLYCVTFMFIYY